MIRMLSGIFSSSKRVFESNDKKLSFSESSSESSESESNDEETQANNRSKNVLKSVFVKWLLLALIATFMAIWSLAIDLMTTALGDLTSSNGLMHVWILYSVICITIAASVVKLISKEAVGSGIPEIKTILRGVQLEGYLNFKTLVAVLISLSFALSSNIPIGKAGPFVHAAATVAHLTSKLIKTFDTGSMTGSLHNEMLAAGCAVGLACTFGAPVGGVLFSIEVTSTFFALPQTCFFVEELPLFALIGLFCGLGAALFIALHRKVVLFRRNNAKMKKIFDKHWLIYPVFVSILISSLTYPDGFGNYLGGEHKFSKTTHDLFLNCTWSASENSTYKCPDDLLNSWLDADEEGKELNLFVVLSTFSATFFVLTSIAITLPVPAGIFGPAFAIGSGFGRLIGELVAITYPNGVRNDGQPVWPSVYAVVGAASFCGGITHTISTAVVTYELTGQLVYILPVMISVLIANAVCSYLQPSIYESLIELRALPYLPNIPNSENFHGIKVSAVHD
ncbi:hypothetical protein M3Y97_00116000 [Aphelenchoides bicaudatus]|nr:hypothetical protein M3Y97_00116000 [Aphelenchoides bicaudatus]